MVVATLSGPGAFWTLRTMALTEADIQAAVREYATAARLAIEAGFDGIELHAANGYLLEQFLNGNVNGSASFTS